jgi:hypothetical protein
MPDKGHRRVEIRELQVMDVPPHLNNWPGIKQILKITRTRIVINKTSIQIAYGITSLSSENANHLKIMKIWKDHWRIENQLHWVRDMVFDEDRCTIRKGNSPQIMAALRISSVSLV